MTRLPANAKIVLDRSRCDACGHVLPATDLFPVLSAIRLRFRCRFCHGVIHPLHLFAELGALGVAILAASVAAPHAVAYSCVLGWLLLVTATIDCTHLRVPNLLTGSIAATGIIAAIALERTFIDEHLAGGVVGLALLLGVAGVYRQVCGRDGLGRGDAKLLGAIGMWVSVQRIPDVLLISSLLGLAYVGVLALRGEHIDRRTKLPFGSFLSAAGWLVWLFGPAQRF